MQQKVASVETSIHGKKRPSNRSPVRGFSNRQDSPARENSHPRCAGGSPVPRRAQLPDGNSICQRPPAARATLHELQVRQIELEMHASKLAHVSAQPLVSIHESKPISMLWTICVILIILWLLGLVTGTTIGGLIHVLLVIAIIVVLLRVISGRKPL